MARLLLDDVTLVKNDHIHLHVRFRGGQTTSLTIPIPPMAWQARQTEPDTLALLDRLLDDHTDAEVADALNAAGHRSGEGKPFTARIVLHLRRAHQLPSHADRLRAAGMLTLTEIAAAPRRPHPHRQGLARRRPARRPQGQRQERTALRTAHSRRSPARQVHGPHALQPSPHRTDHQEVQCETNALSFGLAARAGSIRQP